MIETLAYVMGWIFFALIVGLLLGGLILMFGEKHEYPWDSWEDDTF